MPPSSARRRCRETIAAGAKPQATKDVFPWDFMGVIVGGCRSLFIVETGMIGISRRVSREIPFSRVACDAFVLFP